MSLETAQLLCAVSWRFGVVAPYKLTHAKHPCTLWAGDMLANWEWLVAHGKALCAEYTRRYGKQHASLAVILWCERQGGRPPAGALTAFAQAMPESYRDVDVVRAYRAYYAGEKRAMASWKAPSAPPAWW